MNDVTAASILSYPYPQKVSPTFSSYSLTQLLLDLFNPLSSLQLPSETALVKVAIDSVVLDIYINASLTLFSQ